MYKYSYLLRDPCRACKRYVQRGSEKNVPQLLNSHMRIDGGSIQAFLNLPKFFGGGQDTGFGHADTPLA